MQESARTTVWKIVLVVIAVFSTAALSAAGWYYRYARLQDVPPPAPQSPNAARPIGVIVLSRQPSGPPSTAASSELAPTVAAEGPHFHFSSPNPMELFRDDLRKALLQSLTPAFPQLPTYLTPDREKGRDPEYRRFVIRLIDGAENGPADLRPAMLLAADFLADALWCPSEGDSQHLCDDVRNDFAQHKLSLQYSELGGGSFYQHDLLWRVRRDYPTTDWGERAFVLLLDSGWDTSTTCAKGGDQFREVIHQGESFLQQHPNSVYSGFVEHLVGQAYTTWWTLSNQPLSGMEDYVSPKQYQEGAAEARLKAIALFEQVLQLAPGTALGEYARQILPTLRDQQVIEDGYRFFCVYD